MRIGWKISLFLWLVAGIGLAGWLSTTVPGDGSWAPGASFPAPPRTPARPGPARSGSSHRPRSATAPGTACSRLTPDQVEGIGLKTVVVKAQTEPIMLRLTGMTDYDPATLTTVRLPVRLPGRSRCWCELGSVVKKGDPLLELFSTDLAEAKSDYETARSQWTRDKKVLDYKAPLAKSEAMPARS